MTCLTLSPPIFCTSPMSRKRTSTLRLVSLLRRMSSIWRELEIGIADQGDFLVLELDGGRRALEVKAGGDFLGGVVDRVSHFRQVGFANSIERGHGGLGLQECWDATILPCSPSENVPLQACNTFGIVAKAFIRWCGCAARPMSRPCWPTPSSGRRPKFVLGGGSNVVLTGDVKPVVLKVEILGRRLVEETAQGLDRRGRRRRELARLRGLDAGPGLARAWRTWR